MLVTLCTRAKPHNHAAQVFEAQTALCQMCRLVRRRRNTSSRLAQSWNLHHRTTGSINPLPRCSLSEVLNRRHGNGYHYGLLQRMGSKLPKV